MLRDAVTQDTAEGAPGILWLVAAPPAILLSLVFYLSVRIGGQFGSFEYRPDYATLEEVAAVYR